MVVLAIPCYCEIPCPFSLDDIWRIVYSKKANKLPCTTMSGLKYPDLTLTTLSCYSSPRQHISSVIRLSIAVFKMLVSSSYIQIVDSIHCRLRHSGIFISFSLASAHSYRCIRLKYLSFMRNGLSSTWSYCVRSQAVCLGEVCAVLLCMFQSSFVLSVCLSQNSPKYPVNPFIFRVAAEVHFNV